MITNPDFISFQIEQAQKGRDALVDNMKLITYNAFPQVFDYVDFKNDDAFQEPILYAFFNSPKRENIELLKCILLTYVETDKQKLIEINFTEILTLERPYLLYIPTLGILNTSIFCPQGKLSGEEFLKQAKPYIRPLPKTQEIPISLIPVQLELLAPFYYDVNNVQIDVDVSSTFEKNKTYFNQAYTDISKYIEWLGTLACITVKNAVLFDDNTNPHDSLPCKRNSYATFSVNGISFHNCYQPWYDKVFFYDDIAHQMGHVIFYSIIRDKKSYFQIDPESTFKNINTPSQGTNFSETRNHETVFHALYTYYTTLVTLDKMYENAKLTNVQKQEILARIGFYLNKFYLDLSAYDKVGENDNVKNVFTEKGVYVFNQFVEVFKQSYYKYYPITKGYHYSNQTYNFNWSRFMKANKAGLLTH